jgi:hypothetical protein
MKGQFLKINFHCSQQFIQTWALPTLQLSCFKIPKFPPITGDYYNTKIGGITNVKQPKSSALVLLVIMGRNLLKLMFLTFSPAQDISHTPDAIFLFKYF